MTQVDEPTQTRYRVFIVEDHPLVRGALKQLLAQEPSLEVTGEAASAESALDMLEGGCPDVMLVDFSLPGMDGVELVRKLSQSHPGVRCLMVSAHHEQFYVDQALEAGASGYIVKGSDIAVIPLAITRVMHGEVVIEKA